MPHAKVHEIIPATSAEVFALLHDYERRLTWDTLLSEAYLADGFREARVGATSVCRGKKRLGGIALKTTYLVFKPGEAAAIRMINRPPFFEAFAASIRHSPHASGGSCIEYTFQFTARPRWLRFILHPIMGMMFKAETRKRLRALRRHFEAQQNNRAGASN
jgi:hypothetical protein